MPLSTTCQWHLPRCDNSKVSLDIAKCSPRDRITPNWEPLFKSFGPSSSWFLQPLVTPQLRSFHILSFLYPLACSYPSGLCPWNLGAPVGSRTHIYLARARPAEILRNQNKIARFSFCSYLRKRQTPPRLEGDWGFLVGISVLRTGMMRSEFIFKLSVAFVWRGRANFAEQEVNEGVLSGAGCRSGLALCLCCWLSEWLYLPEPQFSHLFLGDKNCTCSKGCYHGFKESMHGEMANIQWSTSKL